MTSQADDRKEPAMTGAEQIAAERRRQIDEEGWTEDHDAGHDNESLALAAAVYATPADRRTFAFIDNAPAMWPWHTDDFKPTPNNRVRELVKAGALIAAEIDRLQR